MASYAEMQDKAARKKRIKEREKRIKRNKDRMKTLPGFLGTLEKKGIIRIGMGMDLSFFLFIIVLLVIGLIMLFSASYAKAYDDYNDSYYYLTKQIGFALFGVFVMIGASYVNYNLLHKFAFPVLIISYIALIGVMFTPGVKGIHRWFEVGGIRFQASEITKFALILFFAHWGSIHSKRMHTFKFGIAPALIVLGTTAGLLFLEPHYSGIVIVGLLTFMMIFLAGADIKQLLALGAVAVVAVLLLAVTGKLSYAMERIGGLGNALEYVNEDLWQSTWQTRNSLYAIGSGGVDGLGLGQSRQKYGLLPEPQNDFIFAIVCEELGLAGAVIILTIFAILVWRGITMSLRAKDLFGRLLGIGLTSQIAIQVILNILVITDLLPNTGISLPFFSYGGTSLIMLLAQMGIVLSISRTANIEKQ